MILLSLVSSPAFKYLCKIFRKIIHYGLCLNFGFLSYVEVVENEEEECDTDLERQNVEELYDYVRHLHQRESQDLTFDVQHKALIPVLRPYQSQAVNWMLRREKSMITSPRGTQHCLVQAKHLSLS